MRLPRRQFLHMAAGAVAFPAVVRAARAQTYQSRPTTVNMLHLGAVGLSAIVLLIAERHNFFKKHGVDVRLASVTGTSVALEQADRVKVDAEQATAQAIHARLADASASLRDLLEQADVLRFEMTKGEKELLDADVDQRKLLASRALPPLPTGGPADERWRVDGEWWSDEIGYQRATLKDGCPAQKATPSVR